MAAQGLSELAVLVLAAGKGERVGGPKALLMIDGEPLAALHRKRAPNGARVIVVTRASIARALERFDLSLVISDEPDALGPAGSIRAAVQAGALDDAERVLVTPVDVPPSPPERLGPLLDALEQSDAARWDRGHPIAIRASVLRERYATEAPILRDVLRSLGDRCARLVGNPCGPTDLDTPEDVLRLTGALPRFFGV